MRHDLGQVGHCPGGDAVGQADQGPSRAADAAMWGSIEDSQAALSVLGPEVNRLLGPLMAALSEFIGAGEVLSSDLARQD